MFILYNNERFWLDLILLIFNKIKKERFVCIRCGFFNLCIVWVVYKRIDFVFLIMIKIYFLIVEEVFIS